MKRRLVAIILLLLPFQFLVAQEKPNIVFIAIDDLNDYVSCMKSAVSIPTPNIDKLASQGMLFTNAHCQAPVCGPSRASIMTGLFPSTSGNYFMLKDYNIKKGSEAVSKATFLNDYFKEYGYKTMGVGKIYHGGDEANTFDEFGGCFDWAGPYPPERLNYDPKKLPNKVGNTLTDWGAYPDQDSLMSDYKVAGWAVNKLKQKYDQPFFLAVGFLRPHVPWYVPQKWFDMFPLDKVKTPPYKKDDMDDVPEMGKRVADVPMMPTTEELIAWGKWKEVVQAYSACVAFVDAQIGKVLDALEQSEHAKNTIVVLWSDHGYHLGEKNRVAKHALWEQTTRTVLIFKDLKNQGKTCSAPVGLIDIYPTLVELSGLPAKSDLDGHSLVGLINNPKMKWEHPARIFYGEKNISIRTDRFRLTQYEDNSQEFYDMKKDPNEWYNLASDKKYEKNIQELQKYIPSEWAPNSQYSGYNINEYFKMKSGWK